MKNPFFLLITLILLILEITFIYIFFLFDYNLYKEKKETQKLILKKIEYYINKKNTKITILLLRDYISYEGKLNKDLINNIVSVLNESILTKDAYLLASSIIDQNNRPYYLKICKLSDDPYIKYISQTYYYLLINKKLKDAFLSTYTNFKENIDPKYKWLIDILDNPISFIIKSYGIQKLKEIILHSTNDLTKIISTSILISYFNYCDEDFYTNLLSTNNSLLFTVSTIGIFQTAQNLINNNQHLKNFEKYSYFLNNKDEDPYKYYSILLIIPFTAKNKALSIYTKYLDFDILRDYKDIAISIVMINYLYKK